MVDCVLRRLDRNSNRRKLSHNSVLLLWLFEELPRTYLLRKGSHFFSKTLNLRYEQEEVDFDQTCDKGVALRMTESTAHSIIPQTDILRDNVTAEEVYARFWKFGKVGGKYTHHCPEGPELELDEQTDNWNKLNWLSINDLGKNTHLMDWKQLGSYNAIFNYHNHQAYNQPQYVTNTVLAIACGLPHATAMCFCGTRGRGDISRKSTCCKHRKYCDRCANAIRVRNFKKFHHVYNTTEENCYLLTLTVEEKFKMVEGQYELIQQTWNKLREYATALFRTRALSGGILTEEMSIDGLDPDPLVNPHVHVLCTSPHEIESHEFEGIKIHVNPIKSETHWLNSLGYMIKVMDFSKTYIETWTPENAETVNRNLREIVVGHSTLFSGRLQSGYFGTFHGRNKFCVAMDEEEYNKLYGKTKPKKKKACKERKKKIKCNQTMPEPITQQPAPTPEEKKPQSSWLKTLAPVGLLGGLATGAYLYGRGGNNFLSGFSNAVDTNVIDPAMKHVVAPTYLRAEPYIQKVLPQTYFGDKVNQYYDNTVKRLVRDGELGSQIDKFQHISDLDGTELEGLKSLAPTPDAIRDIANTVGKPAAIGMHGLFLGQLTRDAAGLGLAGISKLSPTAGQAAAGLLSRIPGLGALNTVAGKAMTPLAIAAGLPAANSLGDFVADRYNLGETGRLASKGALGLTHAGSVLGGAWAGAKLGPGPWGKLIGSIAGASAVPLAEYGREVRNRNLMETYGTEGKLKAIQELLVEGLRRKEQYGNTNMLDSVKRLIQPEVINRSISSLSDQELASRLKTI